MNNIFKYLTNNRVLFFAGCFTLVFILYITLILSRVSSCFILEVGTNSLGLSFYYTKDMVLNFFELRSKNQLLCYSEFLKIWDVIFAVIYTMMYASWIAYLLKNKRLYLIIPILAMGSDWLENYIELLMIATYLKSNSISESLVLFGSGINSMKWTFSTLTYLIILFGIIITLIKFIKKLKLN